MTHDASHSYTYDAEGRVTAVDAGSAATYYYNAQGYRVHRASGASSLEYVYDLNGNVVSEIQSNGALNASYLYFGGNLVAEYASGTTYFVHKDHLGSTRLITKLDKSISDSMDYLPFGEQIAGASGTSHKFTADERDVETNLDHTDFRQYSSALGRWITPDPAGVAVVDPTNPQSWNRYAYVLNDPLDLIDLLGLCGETAVTGVDSGGNTTVFVGAACPPSDGIGFGLLLDAGAPNLIYRDGGHGNVRFGMGTKPDSGSPGGNGSGNPYLVEIGRQLAPLNKLSDCTGEAIANQVPFGNKIFGTAKGPADPVGTTLDTAEKLSSNEAPAKVVWGLNKVGLPALSEIVENGLTKVVSFLSPFAEKITAAGSAVAAYTFVHDTSSCYNKPGG